MLAMHLRRLERPVRYGVNEPRPNTATQNLIATLLRAYDVPGHVNHVTRPPFMGHGEPIFGLRGLEPTAMKGLLRTGDPAHLAVLGDLLQDRGVTPQFDPSKPLNYQSPHNGGALLGALLHINRQAADPRNRQAFHPANFTHPDVSAYLADLMQMPGIPGNAYYREGASRSLQAYPPGTIASRQAHVLGNYQNVGHPQAGKLEQAIGQAQTGHLPHILHLYNMLAHGLSSTPGEGNRGEFHATEDLQQLLHHHAIPAVQRQAGVI